MRWILIILFLLNSCSFTDVGYFSKNSRVLNDLKDESISYENDYTITEYKILLNEYSKNNDYPNMNK